MKLIADKVSKFEGQIKKSMKEWGVPGLSVAIVYKNQLLYSKGFGVKKKGTPDSVNEQTVFQIGSISKTFTSALVSLLIAEGKIHWKDRVIDHLPNFKLHDPEANKKFTIQDLLSQHSGLPPHSGQLLPFLGFDRNYILNSLRYIRPVNAFRKSYGYQNNLFLVAAAIIEKCTGESWELFLSKKILNPLSLSNTTTTLAEYKNHPNAAYGDYYNGPGPDSPVKSLSMNWPYHQWVYTIAPAGGINSNILDLANWLKIYLNNQAESGSQPIKHNLIRFLLSPSIDAGPGVWGEQRFYCKGWVRSAYLPYPIIWHNGGTSGMKGIIAMVRELQMGIVILSNLAENLLPEALSRIWFDLWLDKPTHDWSRELLEVSRENCCRLGESPAPQTPSRPLRRYTGTYYNELYGSLTIRAQGHSLEIIAGPNKVQKKLVHWGGDTFVLFWPGVITNGAGIQFYTGKSGIVDRLSIQGMNDNLTGFFIR